MFPLLDLPRRIFAIFESIVALLVVNIATGQKVPVGDYITALNKTGIFVNRVQQSIPQTVLHDIVLEHFTKARSNGKNPKCLVIGFDGARADALVNAKDVQQSGVLVLQQDGGKVYSLYTGGKFPFLQGTVTACGWTTLLTGHWAKEPGGRGHGVTANGMTKAASAPKLIFTELLEEKLAQKTSFVVSWSGHFADNDATYQNDIAYCAAKNLSAEWITTKDDRETYKQTKALLEQQQGPDMVMCILEACDHAGHSTGQGNQNPEYVEAYKESDRDAAGLISAVKGRANYANEDWLILIASDHGGIAKGHGHQFAVERQIFLVSNQKSQYLPG